MGPHCLHSSFRDLFLGMGVFPETVEFMESVGILTQENLANFIQTQGQAEAQRSEARGMFPTVTVQKDQSQPTGESKPGCGQDNVITSLRLWGFNI